MRVSTIIMLSAFFIFPMTRAREDPCRCKDANAPYRYRSHEKHATDFLNHPAAGDTITCRDIIAWENRYRKKTKKISRQSPRVPGSPEDSLYTLAGYMYYVRHESRRNEDCDLHIEIGTEDASAMRAVVEVTNDNCALQKMIIDRIASSGYSLGKEFDAGLPCVVRGLGFYDGHQKPFTHGRPGKTNVSSWELHPVMSIEFK